MMSKITKWTKVAYLDLAESVIVLNTVDTTAFINLSEIVKIEVNNDLDWGKQYFRLVYENWAIEDYFVDDEDNMSMLDYIIFNTILWMDLELEDFEEVEEIVKPVKEKKAAAKSSKKEKPAKAVEKKAKKPAKKVTKKK